MNLYDHTRSYMTIHGYIYYIYIYIYVAIYTHIHNVYNICMSVYIYIIYIYICTHMSICGHMMAAPHEGDYVSNVAKICVARFIYGHLYIWVLLVCLVNRKIEGMSGA